MLALGRPECQSERTALSAWRRCAMAQPAPPKGGSTTTPIPHLRRAPRGDSQAGWSAMRPWRPARQETRAPDAAECDVVEPE